VLIKLRKANLAVAKVEQRVYVFQEHCANDPEPWRPSIRHLCETQGEVFSNIVLCAPKPPMQAPELEGGPRMKLEALIWNSETENVIEASVLKSQGNCPTSLSRRNNETTHEYTGPGPVSVRMGARNLVIYCLYTPGASGRGLGIPRMAPVLMIALEPLWIIPTGTPPSTEIASSLPCL
jgi:hypothetical protein